MGFGESGQAILIIAVDKKKNWVRTFGPEIYAL
jgi:hypothetical protein